jgi:hypothetical protein
MTALGAERSRLAMDQSKPSNCGPGACVIDRIITSARRMLHALGDGETDPAALAALADQRLRATPEQLRHAFGACADLHPVYRRLVKLTVDELRRSKTTSVNSINTWRSCSLTTTMRCHA